MCGCVSVWWRFESLRVERARNVVHDNEDEIVACDEELDIKCDLKLICNVC